MCRPKEPDPEIKHKALAILEAIDPGTRAAMVEAWRKQRLEDLTISRLWRAIQAKHGEANINALGYDGFMVIYDDMRKAGYALAERS